MNSIEKKIQAKGFSVKILSSLFGCCLSFGFPLDLRSSCLLSIFITLFCLEVVFLFNPGNLFLLNWLTLCLLPHTRLWLEAESSASNFSLWISFLCLLNNLQNNFLKTFKTYSWLSTHFVTSAQHQIKVIAVCLLTAVLSDRILYSIMSTPSLNDHDIITDKSFYGDFKHRVYPSNVTYKKALATPIIITWQPNSTLQTNIKWSQLFFLL